MNYISTVFSFKINILNCDSSLSYFVSNYCKIKWVTAIVSCTQVPIIYSLSRSFYSVQKLWFPNARSCCLSKAGIQRGHRNTKQREGAGLIPETARGEHRIPSFLSRGCFLTSEIKICRM